MKQNEIGRKAVYLLSTCLNAIYHAFLASRSRLLAAVHKEGEIRGISSKSKILRDYRIFLIQHSAVLFRPVFDLEREIVFNAIIAYKDVCYVNSGNENKCCYKRKEYL